MRSLLNNREDPLGEGADSRYQGFRPIPVRVSYVPLGVFYVAL
jgi:hypothetical protein